MISNTIFYLVGPPGVGKMTVGTQLAGLLDARLVHNHLWLNPVFNLIPQDGVTPLPPQVWALTDKVRQAVFEAASTLVPPSWNLVFTHAAVGQSERDDEISIEVHAVAEARNARLVVVQMVCSPQELARRVATPARRALMKEIDSVAAIANAAKPSFMPPYATEIFRVDVSALTPENAAREILQQLDAGAN